MSQKLRKVAQGFTQKLAQEKSTDIYHDRIESRQKGQRNRDIKWLQKLARQLWAHRDQMENSATNQNDSFKVLRYLQTLLQVTNHLVSTAQRQGMDRASAERYKNSLRIAIHGLASVPGIMDRWSEWIKSFNNSLDQFQPRQFLAQKTLEQTKKEPAPQEKPPKEKPEEEELPLPAELIPRKGPRMIPFPLGAIKDPSDPEGLSAVVPN